MAHRYANLWSQAAAGLTATSHGRASVFRWGVIMLLTLVWIVGGLWYWMAPPAFDFAEALYRTIAAVAMWDQYFTDSSAEARANPWLLQVVRFAALATPVIGLVFAFSGQLGRSLARIFILGARGHVVIAGDSPAALSLARDCRKHRDAIVIIAQGLADETMLGLRRKGVIVFEGDAGHLETLRSARAHYAAHVIAFEPDDTANLQIEAAVRRLVGKARRKPPIGVHVATQNSMLLKEARELRSVQMRTRERNQPINIDPKPFSLDEMAGRALLQQQSVTLLDLAKQLNQPRVHVVFFGFASAAEALAERILSSLWSAHFEPPRLTVMAPNPEATEAGFRARHREVFAHPQLWSADIAFMRFDWDAASIGGEVLDEIEAARGKPTAIVVATGADPGNIHLSIALKRACNHQYRWPVPIFMCESSQSEFSQQYAKGDETAELDAYLQAFGSHQLTATRDRVIDGDLDRGSAVAHEHYRQGLGKRENTSMKDLQSAMRDWTDVLETYRAANRAVADAAMVKAWDAGWRPAQKGERGDTSPTIPTELMDRLAQREHDRWNAERLISGWRPTMPGEARSNELMAHDKLKPWGELNAEDRNNDVVQVRAGLDIARAMHPQGFVKRGSS